MELEQCFRLLEADQPRQAAIVELRVYGGLSELEVAEILGVSSATVREEFAKAKRHLAYYLKTTDKPVES